MNCPVCNSQEIQTIYTNPSMPLGVNVKDEVLDIEVALCKGCDFVFQKSAYSDAYDHQITKLYESYTISSMYNFPNRNKQHLKALSFVQSSIENREDFNVLEIGSNRGDFLYMLKEKFDKINILGFEPTTFKDLKVPTINAFFDEKLLNTKFDLIILRHTLEHIKYPKEFIKRVYALLNQTGKLFIEVPNLDYSLREFIEDFTPDHVNYFTTKTLLDVIEPLHCLKFEDETFLYMLIDQNAISNEALLSKLNYEEAFEAFNSKIEEAKRACEEYDRVLFYGVSNFYLWTYTKLKAHLHSKTVGFIDDHLDEDKLFGLKKVNEIKQSDLVILCTSNQDIQANMINNLPKGVNILRLFKGVDRV